MATSAARTLRIEPERDWPSLGVAEAAARWELLCFFVWRDIKVRYKQTLLGIAWAVLQPLAAMIVFSVIFGRLAHLDSDGVPYPVFSLAGLLPWTLFAGGLTMAAGSLVNNVNLLTKVYFPRVLLPLSHVVAGLLDFAVSFVLLSAALLWYGIVPGTAVVCLPLSIVIAMAAAAGAGMWLAALNAQYRDVRYAMPFVVQLWMYATPIVYSLRIVPEAWQAIYAVNPMVGAVALFRHALFGTANLSAGVVATSGLSALVLLATGAWYFGSMERTFADTI